MPFFTNCPFLSHLIVFSPLLQITIDIILLLVALYQGLLSLQRLYFPSHFSFSSFAYTDKSILLLKYLRTVTQAWDPQHTCMIRQN